jgi:hypothetical protein
MKKHKIKNKAYARPLILTEKEFTYMLHFDFKRLNPNVKIESWITKK